MAPLSHGQDPPEATVLPYELEGHESSINSVAYTPDGAHVVTASSDMTVRLWETAGGKEIRVLSGHTGQVTSVTVDPSGRMVLSGAADNAIRLWDLPRPDPLLQLAEGTEGLLRGMGISPDAKLLVTGGDDMIVRVWSLVDSKEQYQLKGHREKILEIAYRADGNQLASSDQAGVVKLWDPLQRSEIHQLGAHEGPLRLLAYHPNNQQLVTAGDDGVVRTWQLAILPTRQFPVHETAVSRVRFSANNQSLITSDGAQLAIYTVADQKLARVLEGQVGEVVAINRAGNDSLVASGNVTGQVRFWNMADGQDRFTVQASGQPVSDIVFHADNVRVTTSHRDGTVHLWKLPVAPVPMEGHAAGITTITFRPDGLQIASGSEDKSVRLWNPAGGAEPILLAGHEAIISEVIYRPDGQQLVSADQQGVVKIWNPANGEQLASIQAHEVAVTGMSFHPEGNRLVTAAADGSWKEWALPIVAPRPLAGPTEQVNRVAINSDGSILVAGGADKVVRLFNGVDGQPLRTLDGHDDMVTALAMDVSGEMIASGSDAGVLRFWNVADGASRLQLAGHQGAVNDVVLLNEQQGVLSAGADGTIRRWRLPVAPRPHAGHTLPVGALAASRDGTWLLSGSADKSVRIWNRVDGAAVGTLAEHQDMVSAVVVSEKKDLVVSGDQAGVVYAWPQEEGATPSRLLGHAGRIIGLGFADKEKRLISASENGVIRWWELPLIPSREIVQQDPVAGAVMLGSDGVTAIVGSGEAGARLVDAGTGEDIRLLEGQQGAVTSVTLSADRALAAAGTDKGIVQLWKSVDGSLAGMLRGHQGNVTAVVLGKQPGQVISAGADGTVRAWKMAPEPTRYEDRLGDAGAVAYSPDGTMVAIGMPIQEQAGILVRELQSGKVLYELLGHQGPVVAVAFSADGSRIASGSMDKTLRVWALEDVKFAELISLEHPGPVTAVAFNKEGTEVFGASSDNGIHQWSMAEGTETRLLAGHTAAISSLVQSGDLIISGSADSTIRSWNAASGAAAGSINNTAAVTSLAVSPDGLAVATGAADNMVRLWTRANGAALATFAGHVGPVASVQFDAAGTRLISTAAEDVRVWETSGRQREVHPASEVPPRSASFLGDPDKQQLVVLQNDGRIEIRLPTLMVMLAGHEGVVSGLAVDAAGEFAFSCGMDKTVRQWDLASGKQLRVFAGATDAVNGLALAAEGGRLFAACSDKNVYAWQVPVEGEEASVAAAGVMAHVDIVRAVSTNADGSRLAAVGDDKLVTVWDTASGLVLEQLAGHTEAVLDVSLSADGTTLVSGSTDKTVRWWQLAAQQVVQADATRLLGFAVNADGNRAISVGEAKVLSVWSVLTGEKTLDIPTGEQPVQAIAIAPDGLEVSVGNAVGLRRWPLAVEDGQLTSGVVSPLVAETSVVAIDYAGPKTILVATAGNQVHRISTVTGKTSEIITLAVATPSLVAVAGIDKDAQPAGILVAAANDPLLQVISVDVILTGHAGAVTGLAVDGTGAFAFSCGLDKTVRQWDLASGRQLRVFSGATDAVNGLVLAEEGNRLFAASSDKKVYSWAVPAEGGAEDIPASSSFSHAAIVRAVSTNADGSRLAAVGDDKLVTVWDTASGLVLEQLAGHTEAVLDVSLSADGTTLVSGSTDKTARWWQLAAQQVVQADEKQLLDIQYSVDGLEVFTSGLAGGVWRRKLDEAEAVLLTDTAAVKMAVAGEAGDLVLASMDGTVTRWALETGEKKATIKTTLPDQEVMSMSMSVIGDGSRVAVGHGMQLQLFDFSNGELLESFPVPGPVTASAISSDGARVAMGQKGAGANFSNHAVSALEVWRISAKEVVSHTLSPNGQFFFAATETGTVQMHNLLDGELVRTFGTGKDRLVRLSVSSDNLTLGAASSDKRAYLWTINPEDAGDLPADEVLAPLVVLEHPEVVSGLDFSNNSARLATSCGDGRVRIWNREDGQLLEWFESHQGACLDVDFMDDRSCASAGLDKHVKLQSTSVTGAGATGAAVYPVFEDGIRDGQLVAAGAQLLVGSSEGDVVLLNLANGQRVREFEGATSPVVALAAAPDNSQLVASTEDQRLLLWTMADGTLKGEFKTPSPVTLAQFSSDNLKIVTASEDQHLRFYSSEDLRELYELVSDEPIVSLLFQQDNRHLFTGHESGISRKWLYASPESVRTFTGHGGPVYGLSVSADSRLFASASQDQTIRIWDIEAGNQLKQLSGHQGAVYSVAFSSDGSLLVSCGADKTMRLWDVRGGRQLKQVPAGDAGLYSVTLNPDGKRAAVAGLDKKIRIYDVFTGELLNTLEKHKDYIYRVNFNSKGDRLLSCGYGGHIVLWNGTSGEPLFEHEFDRVSNFADLAPDGSRIFVAGGEGTGRFIDIPPDSR
jgi:WD40 repeat protein